MNYIGSKRTLLPFIGESVDKITLGNYQSVADVFAGTGVVADYFKHKGKSTISNDLQYYSYVINRGTVGITHPLDFSRLKDLSLDKRDPVQTVVNYLNNIPKVLGGFIEQNYSPAGKAQRMYFTIPNSEKADAIRQKIEEWYQNKQVGENEYYYLLYILLSALDKCANTASVYGAYLKKFKKTALSELKLIKEEIFADGKNHMVYNDDADQLVGKISADVFYLDPPYNTRQYASNYHVLEMVAKYDPDVVLHGKTGLYNYSSQRSDFSSKQHVKEAFTKLINSINGKYIFLSYNDEGILPLSDIKKIMSQRGEYGYFTQTYHRYKADSSRIQKQVGTTEYLHYVKVKN